VALNVDELKRLLKLEPLPGEGGFFAETYRARESLAAGALGPGSPGRDRWPPPSTTC